MKKPPGLSWGRFQLAAGFRIPVDAGVDVPRIAILNSLDVVAVCLGFALTHHGRSLRCGLPSY